MSTFDSTKTALGKILEAIIEGKIQLPDFQRGWVWDDSHIRDLLVSIARSFPIGSIMLLETGGTARFQIRPVEGVAPHPGMSELAESLILDGQQRLTSLTQVLKLTAPVKTKDNKGWDINRYYFIDIEKTLTGNGGLDDAIFAVNESKILTKNFGRDVVLDLTTQEKEFSSFCFPCNQILNSDNWEQGLMAYDANKFKRYMQFRSQVMNAFRLYDIPVYSGPQNPDNSLRW